MLMTQQCAVCFLLQSHTHQCTSQHIQQMNYCTRTTNSLWWYWLCWRWLGCCCGSCCCWCSSCWCFSFLFLFVFLLLFARLTCYNASSLLGTVENHSKNGKKTRQTFVKIAKIMAKTRQRHGIKSRAQTTLYSL